MGDVIQLNGVTRLDTPSEHILQAALVADLDKAFVVGFDKQGNFYFGSSIADGGTVMWLMEVAKAKMMKQVDL